MSQIEQGLSHADTLSKQTEQARAQTRQAEQLIPQTPDLLHVEQLNAWYGAAHILFDVSLSVAKGEVVALMGRNGAGKSTTLKSIMGLIENTQGKRQFMGQEISQWPAYKIARLGLGYVPEDRRIFASLTVAENLSAGEQKPRQWPDGQAAPHWTVEQLVSLFPNLGHMMDRPGTRMSGGEQQMLSVARTLMGNPYLILLDEPSEGVAPIIVEQMRDMVLSLKEKGVGVLISEQNLDFAYAVADRVYVLEKGQVKFSGTMQALRENTQVQENYLAI